MSERRPGWTYPSNEHRVHIRTGATVWSYSPSWWRYALASELDATGALLPEHALTVQPRQYAGDQLAMQACEDHIARDKQEARYVACHLRGDRMQELEALRARFKLYGHTLTRADLVRALLLHGLRNAGTLPLAVALGVPPAEREGIGSAVGDPGSND